MGRGTQNYTCGSTGTTPTTNGALAMLYSLDSVPNVAYSPITNMAVGYGTDRMSLFGLSLIGVHYFDTGMNPTFDLGSLGFITAKKVGDIKAPANATLGPNGSKAVDWLQLSNKAGSNTTGISEVYRVETAGGSAPASCNTTGDVVVQYAAQYWFYG